MEFRQRLCNAAARLFIERGPDAVTMRNLAQELGCSAMTPYRYFKDKDAILAAVRARGFDEFAEALEQAGASAEDAMARAYVVCGAYLRFATERPHVYRMMFDAPFLGADDIDPDLVRAGERAREQMKAYVRGLVSAGVVDGDPTLIGNLLWAGVHGVVMLSLCGMLSRHLSAETISHELFQAVIERHSPKR
ncbi:MAG TPA: TetR/AcrR family transcriptional regulator [Caulobacterales bacterium]|nr:TetR/AcrR family transcriptional regulator [Caulobacterales bacterium]